MVGEKILVCRYKIGESLLNPVKDHSVENIWKTSGWDLGASQFVEICSLAGFQHDIAKILERAEKGHACPSLWRWQMGASWQQEKAVDKFTPYGILFQLGEQFMARILVLVLNILRRTHITNKMRRNNSLGVTSMTSMSFVANIYSDVSVISSQPQPTLSCNTTLYLRQAVVPLSLSLYRKSRVDEWNWNKILA